MATHYTASMAHGRSRSYATSQGQVYLPTPPYLPLAVAKPQSNKNSSAPSSLAKLAALATLTLLPQHRAHISVIHFAKIIHRYLALVRLPPVITHLTLLYIYRLTKSGFPVHEYTAQQIFVTAYALADTYLDDNAYSNKSWLQVLNDGTDMREWSKMEFHFLSKGLKWRLEANDKEWTQWCEWVCDWWHRAGASDWERLEVLEAQKLQASTLPKPQAPKAVPVVAPKPVKATGRAEIVAVRNVQMQAKQQEIVRAMSVDRTVGWSANAKKRMSQLAEYEFDGASEESESEPEIEEDFDDEDEEEEGVYIEEKASKERVKKDTPVIRRKDSGYCEGASFKSTLTDSHKVESKQAGELKAITKKSSFSFKWNFNMF